MNWGAYTSQRGGLRRWLQATGSLSARLAAAGGAFSVQVLAQGRQPLSEDEARALSLGAQRNGYVREVVLWLDTQPMVLARSVTAQPESRGRWRALRGLGSRPLADVLFNSPGITRQAMEFAALKPHNPLQRHLAKLWRTATGRPLVQTAVPARRSVFSRNGAGLLVMEVFAASADHWRWTNDATLKTVRQRRNV